MRSCTLKPWRICVPGDIKQIFLAARSSGCIFELGGIAKYLVTGPTGFFSLSLLLCTPTQKMVLPWGTLRVLGTWRISVSLGISHSFENALKGSKEVVCSTYQNLRTPSGTECTWVLMHVLSGKISWTEFWEKFKSNEWIKNSTPYKEKINMQFDCQWF